eukprot:scaffold855_cov344-Prasinococcus_capsulatus_cf.AAC.17
MTLRVLLRGYRGLYIAIHPSGYLHGAQLGSVQDNPSGMVGCAAPECYDAWPVHERVPMGAAGAGRLRERQVPPQSVGS